MGTRKPQPDDVLGDTEEEYKAVPSIEELELPPERFNWLYALLHLYFLFGTLYAVKLIISGRVGLASFATGIILGYAAMFGTTIGAHRLWSHRSFKAKIGLRYFLAICQSVAMQKIGWTVTYNPKMYAIQRSYANVEDAEADPVVMWQEKYYDLLMSLAVIIPPLIPWLFFSEEFASAWCITVCARLTITHNCIYSINSLAHLIGYKPYDKGIYARENKLVALLAVGEGWHNYHHTFPWDYRQSEFGGSLFLRQPNWSANIIDFFAKMDWAYDLRIATPELVKARMKRTGDGGK